ncbi:reverse transcriptase [Phytophthora megakarya]|uniref:Reverse transcriptase n=1 Tax=Phytophthora megakarya TaxID=4795 RepID=A0A225VZZ5_9STRA|nr:reverse transcriptase [Phytophthora megakarya]
MKDLSPREQSLVELQPKINSKPPWNQSGVYLGAPQEAWHSRRHAPRPSKAKLQWNLLQNPELTTLKPSVPESTSREPRARKTNRQSSPEAPISRTLKRTPEDDRRERWRKICSHQSHDPGLEPLVSFLRGETEQLSLRQTTHLAKIADQFVLDSRDAWFYVSRNTSERPRDAADRLRLVVLQDLHGDTLHYCHADLQRYHPDLQRLRKEFYWIGMFKGAERYVKECVGCVTAKGLPRNPGSSPSNLLATRPFQVVSMDFVIPLPQSARGNTALLPLQCAFSGFIMCKAMASTEAQDVAEA